NKAFPWAGSCSDNFAPCQPDAAAATTCNAATGGASGCARCTGTAACQGGPTIWDWLNQLNAAGFAGHSDWRIPAIGLDGGAVELETIVDRSVSSGCGTGAQVASPTSSCVAAAFNAGCATGCTASSCSCTQNQIYSSATSVAASTPPFLSAWGVSFFTG